MRRIIISILFLLLVTCNLVIAQTDNVPKNDNATNLSYVTDLLDDIDMRIRNMRIKNRYQLYPTQNMYNFLLLDTETGRIEQLQWSLESEEEFRITLNGDDLSWYSGGSSFELYPTQNIYQFLLLDKLDGRTWHIQWGMKDSKRWIRRIR